ncbi:hypothetical protein HHK36_007091 [Tetracentron sinense]|uniref:HMA domain-containing protein n=1 Tax=Tetracentron sinense TaxID=13715 RepID=A0A834ZJ62_TETSI|nr:hypothetical protein HHK36_007091 [Tetracentron sinense]
MAAIAAFPSLYSICRINSHGISNPSSSSSLSPPLRVLHLQKKNNSFANCSSYLTVKNSPGIRRIRSVDEETLIPEEEEKKEEVLVDQPVSVQVSPSDLLTMFFQAEGAMNESAIPTVINALEEMEGISDLKVQVLEGIASVELSKQTTVQATGVASSLVEIIQGSGFKLQALNLSFEDEEDSTN